MTKYLDYEGLELYTEQIKANLAGVDHGHDASDITDGVLDVERGGTGKTSLQAVREAMGLGGTTGALSVANGGTGASTAAKARSNLKIGSDVVQEWDANDKYQRLPVTKIGNFMPEGHKAQGMATDGSYLYMMSHVNDYSDTYISVVSLATKTLTRRVSITLRGHCNSMKYHDGKIYATAASGTDYTVLGIIPVDSMENYTTVELPIAFWDFTITDVENGVFVAGLVADSHEWVVYAPLEPGGMDFVPVKRFAGYDGSGIIQGCCSDKDYLYNVFAYNQEKYNANNVLAVMEWDGYVRRLFYIDGGNKEEYEDVCVPEGYNGPIYFNDIAGNIYEGNLYNTLKPEYKTWIRSPYKVAPVQNLYLSYNGTETKTGSGSSKVATKFWVHPYTYNVTTAAIIGDLYICGYRFPMSWNPRSMSISCYNSYLRGTDEVYFHLAWKQISSSFQYGWEFDEGSWVYYQDNTYKGAEAIAGSGCSNTDICIDRLTLLSGISPQGSISL